MNNSSFGSQAQLPHGSLRKLLKAVGTSVVVTQPRGEIRDARLRAETQLTLPSFPYMPLASRYFFSPSTDSVQLQIWQNTGLVVLFRYLLLAEK